MREDDDTSRWPIELGAPLACPLQGSQEKDGTSHVRGMAVAFRPPAEFIFPTSNSA